MEKGGTFSVYLSKSHLTKLELLKKKHKIEGAGYSTIINRLIEETSTNGTEAPKKLAIKKKV